MGKPQSLCADMIWVGAVFMPRRAALYWEISYLPGVRWAEVCWSFSLSVPKHLAAFLFPVLRLMDDFRDWHMVV